jgi:nuclear GTP-binding protein
VEAIVSRCAPEQLMKLYNVPFFNTAKDFLLHLALNRGKLKKVCF